MLIALLVAYFAVHGGTTTGSPLLGDPGKLQSAIEHQVKDPARLAQLKALVGDVKAADKEARSQQEAAAKAVEEVAARQATPPAQLEAAVDTLEAGQRARRDKQVSLRLRLAALTTPAEWTAIQAEVFPARAPVPAAR